MIALQPCAVTYCTKHYDDRNLFPERKLFLHSLPLANLAEEPSPHAVPFSGRAKMASGSMQRHDAMQDAAYFVFYTRF
jgi:hypothetical protein